MPTLEENKALWKRPSVWKNGGEDWSQEYGNSNNMWWWIIFPRIHRFLPATTILEIAPGFGRWTFFLKDFAKNLVVVDLVQECINACKNRFSGYSHITYHVNDGKSLSMVPDNSVDFAFSFDSLVHAEEDVIKSYLEQLSHKLKENGIAFIHHSNLGSYSGSFSSTIMKKIETLAAKAREDPLNSHQVSSLSRDKIVRAVSAHLYNPGITVLNAIGVEPTGFRAESMTAKKFAKHSEFFGLSCISQETISWHGRRPIDCISVVTPMGSMWDRPNQTVVNHKWLEDARIKRLVAHLYS